MQVGGVARHGRHVGRRCLVEDRVRRQGERPFDVPQIQQGLDRFHWATAVSAEVHSEVAGDASGESPASLEEFLLPLRLLLLTEDLGVVKERR